MRSFKSYFHPAEKKGDDQAGAPSTVEMKESPLSPRTPAYSGSATPQYSGSGTPYTGSRPASIYPNGDFRNSTIDGITEIKCDVMVNWLYQQQLERMWTNGGVGEGVVLKKSRDAYVACPKDVSQIRNNLYDSVQKLNVRVSMFSSFEQWLPSD